MKSDNKTVGIKIDVVEKVKRLDFFFFLGKVSGLIPRCTFTVRVSGHTFFSILHTTQHNMTSTVLDEQAKHASWFRADVSEEAANESLKGCVPGSFLVRKPAYTLSW